MKSLHDLPKDILIEIILNVKKQNEKEMEELMRKCAGSRINKCGYDKCRNFQVTNGYGELIYIYNNNDIFQCDICSLCCCQSHNKIHFFVCCRIYHCKTHHQCPICNIPMCLFCEKKKLKCDECNGN